MSNSSKDFFQCPSCNSIYVLPSDKTQKCEACQHSPIEKITGRFILRCKTCGLTQNKNSFSQLHGDSYLTCQASNCSGKVKSIFIGARKSRQNQAKKGPLLGFNTQLPPEPPRKRKLAAKSSQEAAAFAKTLASQPKPKIKKSAFLPFPVIENEDLEPPAPTSAPIFTPFPVPQTDTSPTTKSHASIQPGDKLRIDSSQFEVLEKIGTGGMGSVHKLRNTDTGQIAALKEFYYSRFHDPESGNNFCEKYWSREAQISELQSESPEKSMKFVGKLHLTEFHNPEYYIFLEFIDGVPLDTWYGQKFTDLSHLTIGTLRTMIKEVLMPITRHMYYCHQKGIIHRDLTVQNIMIVTDPKIGVYPIVIDWGVAKEISLDSMYKPRKPYYVSATPEATGIRNRGTPPEVMAGFEPIATTDIYMLGHIMFYLFSGGNYASAAATNEDFVLHPGDYNPNLPQEFNKLVEYMTQYEPADRMADMVKVYDALQWLYDTSGKLEHPNLVEKDKNYYLYCDYNQGFLALPPQKVINIGRDEILQVGRTHDMDGHLFNALIPTDEGRFSFQLYIDNNVGYIRDLHSPLGTFLSQLTMPNQQIYNNVAIKGLDNVSIELSEANLGNMIIEVPFLAPDGKSYRIPFKIYSQEVE
ncbi:MAG: protein kinase domain-containing protein [Promethearchaeota archaeon]